MEEEHCAPDDAQALLEQLQPALQDLADLTPAGQRPADVGEHGQRALIVACEVGAPGHDDAACQGRTAGRKRA